MFTHIEELRQTARLSQVDVAELIGVTRRTYIDWGAGGEMHDHREPELRYTAFIIAQGMRNRQLPIRGHDRRPETAERRREVIQELKECYPVNPYSLNSR